ncbi:glycosyltransferase [Alteromonas sp. S005]|uniref:glycosyltransferase n=1 Tax=Alteromonas sp. S005 TaxID=3117400 RepID=UPI002FE2DD64
MIFLYTRFSLVNKNMTKAWKTSTLTVQEQIDNVVANDERLRGRLKIFLDRTVKNIEKAHIEGAQVRHFVFASTLISSWAQDLLSNAEKNYSWLKIIWVTYEEDFNIVESTRALISEEFQGRNQGGVYSLLRLDDDDILAPHFFEYISRYAVDAFVGKAISLPAGVNALYDSKLDTYTHFVESYDEKIAIGLGFINHCSETGEHRIKSAVPNVSHKKIDRQVPLILDGTISYCWIRSLHETNDTYVQRLGDGVEIPIINKVKLSEHPLSKDLVDKYFVFL